MVDADDKKKLNLHIGWRKFAFERDCKTPSHTWRLAALTLSTATQEQHITLFEIMLEEKGTTGSPFIAMPPCVPTYATTDDYHLLTALAADFATVTAVEQELTRTWQCPH